MRVTPLEIDLLINVLSPRKTHFGGFDPPQTFQPPQLPNKPATPTIPNNHGGDDPPTTRPTAPNKRVVTSRCRRRERDWISFRPSSASPFKAPSLRLEIGTSRRPVHSRPCAPPLLRRVRLGSNAALDRGALSCGEWHDDGGGSIVIFLHYVMI
mgnify:CR=1 FL=1